MSDSDKSVIVVLGMHRSGTSVLARALPVLDVNLGSNLMPADVANDKGFFEDLDIKNLNEQFLAALGRRWDSLEPVRPEEMQGEVASRYRRLAAGHLRSKLGEGVFGLKDPRMCRLLPFWKEVFARVRARPVFVIAYRNPASVARSLAARDGFVVEKCHFLWLEYMYSSLRYSAGSPRLVVDYDSLVDEPAAQLARIARTAGLAFDPRSAAFAEYRDDFIKHALRHSRVSMEEAACDPKMPAIVREMAALLSDLAAERCEFGSGRFEAILDRIAGWLMDMRPTLALMQACDEQAVALAKLVRDRDVRIEGLESFIADRHGQAEWATGLDGPASDDGGEQRRQLTIIDDVPGGRAVPLLEAGPLRDRVARLICFYLPQFHPIAENDEWWGEGFTEWVNVRAALAQFPGHAQPEIPGELSYYDLRDPAVQRRQVELARLYGIEGFCFYFYWFGGRRLLEAPLVAYLEDRTLDLPFCLCWANENWTRRWDGLEHEVLIGQKHSADDDIEFIAHVAKYMRDPRYIRVDGKPVLLVYRPGLFPDAKQTAARWRAWCRDHDIGEIFLAYTQSFDRSSPATFGFDAAIEFPPDYASQPDMTDRVAGLNEGFRGVIHDWRILVERSRSYPRPEYMLFRGVNPGWDNTARRGDTAKIYCNSSVLGYQEWLFNAIGDTCERIAEPDRRLLFINAWNEWAEGAFLEPDRRRGYARLEATRVALVRRSIAAGRESELAVAGTRPQIGVVVHAFHEDVLGVILGYLARLGGFDLHLYVTCAPERAQRMRERLADAGIRFELLEYPNRGRDVLPFLLLLPRLLAAGHDLLLKLHTKKSEHRKDGHLWVSDLFDKLLTEDALAEAIAHFQAHPGTGILGPGDHVIPMPHYWGRNAATVKRLSARLGIDASLLTNVRFVAGTMFFFRPQALLPLTSLAIRADDFEEESGQIDGTMAHAMERLFSVSALAAGFATVSPGEDDAPDSGYRYAARTRLPPELATALLERTDALVERLRVTDAGMTKAQTLALERLDEIESLNERIEATDLALHAAEKLALDRLAEAGALRERLAVTEDALRGAEGLALGRMQELERYRQQLESTEKALREAERLALHRLDELEELHRRLQLTDAALRQAEELAHGRLAENQALVKTLESAQESQREAQAREAAIAEEVDRVARLAEAARADAATQSRAMTATEASMQEHLRQVRDELARHAATSVADLDRIRELEERLAHVERELLNAHAVAAQLRVEHSGSEGALASCQVGRAGAGDNNLSRHMKYSVDHMVTRGCRIFGYGWVFHPSAAISGLRLELALGDGGAAALPVEFGRTRDDVVDAFPDVANAVRAGFYVYGGWSGAELKAATLCGETSDGEVFRLPVPVKEIEEAGQWPVDSATRGTLLARGWSLLRRGRWRQLLQGTRRLAAESATVHAYERNAFRGALSADGGKRVLLLIDHDLGGGANMYRERLISERIAAGERVVLVTYQVRNLGYMIQACTRRGRRRFTMAGLAVVEDLAAQGCFDEVMFNNAVSFEHPEAVPELLLKLKNDHRLPLRMVIHDYYTLCPSQFLLDSEGRFCDLPAVDVCRRCLAVNEQGFISLTATRDIEAWRDAWGRCLAVADGIRCFSVASKVLLRRAYPELDERRIEVRPHEVDHVPVRRPVLRPGGPLHLGVVGHINDSKGAGVIRELSEEIRRRGLPVKITVIGTTVGVFDTGIVDQTGAYEHARLPVIVEQSGANLFLFPSVWPETFSFVTQELMEFGLPVVCFDLGAQAERVAGYAKGLVLPLGIGSELLDRLLAFHAGVGHASSDSATRQSA